MENVINYKEKIGLLRRTVADLYKLAGASISTKDIAMALKPFTVFEKDFNEEGYVEYTGGLLNVLVEHFKWDKTTELVPHVITTTGTLVMVMKHNAEMCRRSTEAVDSLFKTFSENTDILLTHHNTPRIGAMASACARLTDAHDIQRLCIVKIIMCMSSRSEELHAILLKVTDLDRAFVKFREHVDLLRKEADARKSDGDE